MTTRAKFRGESVTTRQSGQTIELQPVTTGSKENESFFKWTPFGKIEIGTINPEVKFEPGKEYFVDFTLVE